MASSSFLTTLTNHQEPRENSGQTKKSDPEESFFTPKEEFDTTQLPDTRKSYIILAINSDTDLPNYRFTNRSKLRSRNNGSNRERTGEEELPPAPAGFKSSRKEETASKKSSYDRQLPQPKAFLAREPPPRTLIPNLYS